MPSRTPSTTMASPRTAEPSDRVEAATRPRAISRKYSWLPKRRAKLASAGANPAISRMPMLPPMNEARAERKRAAPGRPFFVIS